MVGNDKRNHDMDVSRKSVNELVCNITFHGCTKAACRIYVDIYVERPDPQGAEGISPSRNSTRHVSGARWQHLVQISGRNRGSLTSRALRVQTARTKEHGG